MVAAAGPGVRLESEPLGQVVRLVLLVPKALQDEIDAARGLDPPEEWWEEAAKQRLRRGS